MKKQGHKEQEDEEGKQQPLTAAPSGLRFLLSEFQLFTPSRALAAQTLTLERTLSDLVNQGCPLTRAELDLTWKTAPPRHARAATGLSAEPATDGKSTRLAG